MSDTIVETSAGKVRGIADHGVHTFKGIPFGATTGGVNRFQPPRPVESWGGVRDAVAFGGTAPQLSTPGVRHPRMSEDCLRLNVWTPAVDDGGRRPVMVWYHGGGFDRGSGSRPSYDGATLALEGDVVCITVNHRLGVLGHLHLGEIAGDRYATSGNLGMLDLIQSLEWVRDNITGFGGDPDNITVFGQSGGGSKVALLQTMPAARSLFHRAVQQSGAGLRTLDVDTAAEGVDALLAELEVSHRTIDQLHEMPYERILEAARVVTGGTAEAGRLTGAAAPRAFRPVVDGISLLEHPIDAALGGRSFDVPLLIGTTRDEDRSAWTSSIRMAEAKQAGGRAPVFMYVFAWGPRPHGGVHGIEINFVFHNMAAGNAAAPNGLADQPALVQQLGADVSAAWLAFARSGDPNHRKLPTWPAYVPDDRSTMIFDLESAVVNDPRGDDRRAWESENLSGAGT